MLCVIENCKSSRDSAAESRTAMTDNNSASECSLLRSIFSDDMENSELVSTSSAVNASFPPLPASPAVDRLKTIITTAIIPVFCGFGVVGNFMTIVILSQRRMTTAMSCRIKRASRAGLVGLAVADLLCCVTALAVTYGRDYDTAAYSEDQQVRVLAAIYGPFVQNACAKSNMWLTVVVAVGRYMVICRPLQARYLVSVTATRLAILAAFVVAVLIELHTLWTLSVVTFFCPTSDGHTMTRYFVLVQGLLPADSRLKMAFAILSTSLGFLVPVGILVFCNYCLICSLKQSNHMARLCSVTFIGLYSFCQGHQDVSTPRKVVYSA